jgi:glycosyltransferase involved in cell wall biosynthesis
MWTLRQARGVLCNTRTEAALITRHFGRQVPTAVIPNGVDADELAEARQRSSLSEASRAGLEVLSVGRLDAYKATERLVEAVPHLPVGSRLVLVGDGSNRARLAQKAQELGISNRVLFVGQVSRAQLMAHYRAADVFSSLSRHESFGLAVLEAGVAGLPVLASDLPAHREVAAFMAAGRVRFIQHDAPPRLVAQSLTQTATVSRQIDPRTWPLPTWSGQVDTILGHYATALTEQKRSA